MLDWPDFGVPGDAGAADREIRDAFERARAGQRVEVACVGGHGRTGTVLACMAILSGVPPEDAVEWVRQAYCRRAVQEPSQQYWISRHFLAGVRRLTGGTLGDRRASACARKSPRGRS